QRLAAEAEGVHAGQVVEGADLRGGVALDGQKSVVVRHAAAVVADFDQLAPAVLEDDVDGDCAGVDGVLDQLFDHRGRTLHHLAGRDLVDEFRGKNLDGGHRRIMNESYGE